MKHGTGAESAARFWPHLARFISLDVRVGTWAQAKGPWVAGAYEFLRFGIKQGWACLFGGLLCAAVIGSYLFYPPDAALSRYDALTLAAIAIQASLLALKMETWEEAKIIALYHVVGTVMEVFKTSVGSWIYPEASVLRIAGVPLFTGFMYASVGSYIARVWRLFDFRFAHHPRLSLTLPLAGGIYVNFFSHHVIWDMRIALFLATVLLFGRTWVYFKVWQVHRRMPLLLGFGLVAVFIWIAENIGTYTRVWLYPKQVTGWSPVSWQKFGSWFLLMIVSYVLVTLVSRPRPFRQPARAECGADPAPTNERQFK
ncbi:MULTISPECIES: DUF817 domain-containing protein [unclassified Methylobacterium]|uniref:DUF817 domain-containing protein n=1 Tax=unclassified Methylobacterium TaxID=2615210 RepID=UPI0006F5D8A9|nr:MULTISPECIES: DUF817 domain-containing protein [unclassified Methylobacterium]KQP73544.1 hypothetical protein ASF60_08790 [Methylobacterium sp. Leaf113]MCK2053414.1 DUF817 domain-containing protein [Methylobacterium sp. 37f]